MEPSTHTAICVRFDSQDHYRELVNDTHAFRAHLLATHNEHPELFPYDFDTFHFHSMRTRVRLDLPIRRLRIPSTREVFAIRPSFLMPGAIGTTDDFAHPLNLKRWAVPNEVLAQIFERDPKVYERAMRALGTFPILTTLFSCATLVPQDLVADEKFTRLEGERAYIATTAACGALLGAELVESSSSKHLHEGYSVVLEQARALNPEYRPRSVCLDGFESSKKAWKAVCGSVTVVLCYLHSVLALYKAAGIHLREQVCKRAWEVYAAESKASFSQRLRRFDEWANQKLGPGRFEDKVRARVAKMKAKRDEFTVSYEVKGAHRTSNMVDRVMCIQARHLSAQRHMRGHLSTAQATVRAHANVWNFHEYAPRTRRKPGNKERCSPFHDINGFCYADNWLENLLIAGYAGARRVHEAAS